MQCVYVPYNPISRTKKIGTGSYSPNRTTEKSNYRNRFRNRFSKSKKSVPTRNLPSYHVPIVIRTFLHPPLPCLNVLFFPSLVITVRSSCANISTTGVRPSLGGPRPNTNGKPLQTRNNYIYMQTYEISFGTRLLAP